MNEKIFLTKIYEYLVDIIGKTKYEIRKLELLKYYQQIEKDGYIKTNKKELDGKYLKIFFEKDYFINYLYQLELYIFNLQDSDMVFNARFIPKMLTIGINFDYFTKIKNVDIKVKKMIKNTNKDVDNDIFEILTAIMYFNNGAEDVEFIPETSTKSPNIKCRIENKIHYAECKKRIKESEYAQNERLKWYNIFKPVREYLVTHSLPLIVEIVFHKELTSYSDSYLIKRIQLILDTPARGILIDNDEITLKITDIYLKRTQKHLINNSVRHDTPLLQKLLFDFYDPKKGITYGISGTPDSRNKKYLDTVNSAYAGIWSCDNNKSLENKTKSFKKRVSEALKQFPNDENCSIHLCYEPFDGDEVRNLFLMKNIQDLMYFNPKEVKLDSIYIHFLGFFMKPDVMWETEENCVILKNQNNKTSLVLNYPYTLYRDN